MTFIYKLLDNDINAPDLLCKLSLPFLLFTQETLKLSKQNSILLTCNYTQPLLIALVALLLICQIHIYDFFPSLIQKLY